MPVVLARARGDGPVGAPVGAGIPVGILEGPRAGPGGGRRRAGRRGGQPPPEVAPTGQLGIGWWGGQHS